MKDKIDTTGLPKELLNQLRTKKADSTNSMILEAIKSLGGIADINEILISIYKTHKTIKKRPHITQIICRMVNQGIIQRVKERKGVYSYER
jgi:hypothetical protein